MDFKQAQTLDSFVSQRRGVPLQPAKPLAFDFLTIPGDPLGVKIYTLRNGMKLFLSFNDAEPRIYTNIAIRAGSKHDPADATGLAHYLEHMVFKGTSQIGALNWEKEKIILQRISDRYERHRHETDPERRKLIYKEIDEISGEAAKLVAANEYDKLVASLGAKATNAYTWVDQTVYVNDIPSNELERWMQLESERFKMVALRLFHTELETVYEEFNMSQDRDYRKVSAAANEVLFPTHPYGTQTTLGKSEHLKNPSHVKIQEFFANYYNPNNMAVVLAGDFDPVHAADLAERYFGGYEAKSIPPFTYEPQPELQEVVRREVFGQEAAYVQLDWRFGGANSKDSPFLLLLSRLLNNGKAGLIDLNLLQKQQVLEARASMTTMEDFSVLTLYGKPREGQTLEQVEALLLAQLDLIKQGNFEDWLLEACLKNLKLKEMYASENNSSRVNKITNNFIWGVRWDDYVNRFYKLAAISKEGLVRFAQDRFHTNYVAIFKRTGNDPNVLKMEKPAITPVPLNRSQASAFGERFLSEMSQRLEPVFVDYKKEIQTQPLSTGIELDYLRNHLNPTFVLDYIFEMGSTSDKELALAIRYLPFLGTDKFSPEKLRQEFFRLGLHFEVNVQDYRCYVTLSGLDESFEEGVGLFEHLLANVKGDVAALSNLVEDILQRRQNARKDKSTILNSAMASYARYGKRSPYTNILSASELRAMHPEKLVAKIKSLANYEHRIFYYGSKAANEVAAILAQKHPVQTVLQPVIPAQHFEELPSQENQVFFVDFPMVQAEIMLVSKGTATFNLEEHVMAFLYNAYFGMGLSSIVFQEIREARAMAYSARVSYSSPAVQNEAHYLRGFVGTQADKLPQAIAAMQEIIEEMPFSEPQILQAVQSIQKQIETGRIVKENIYWSYRNAKDRGFERDLRQDVYEGMKVVTPEDLVRFHERFVKGRKYTFLVLGSRNALDMKYLEEIGRVTELSLEEVFGG